MAITPLYVNNLESKTTLSDDDLVIIGEGDDAKKMAIAQLKEELGINALNTNLGAIESEYFTENDSAIWITPGTYIFMINYSISGTGAISVSGYNFTDSESIGFAINFSSPSNARGDIVRAITAEKSMQVGIHATGSTTSVLAQITAVRLK